MTSPADNQDPLSPLKRVWRHTRPACWRDFARGAVHMMPMSMAAAPFGIMVGVLAARLDWGLSDILLMSATVFAGAAQFTALGMWPQSSGDAAAAISGIIGITALINLRHLLMGAAIAPYIRPLPWRVKGAFLFTMADENWAIAMTAARRKALSGAYLMGTTLPFYVNWLIWTALGHILGRGFGHPERWGLDFIFVAVFLTMITGFYKAERRALPLLASAGTALAVHLLAPGGWSVIAGAVAGTAAGVLRPAGQDLTEDE